jgi:sterol desaturase/sphingolipid hydroxylase (fatty acid hydroxylase superfamily)
MLSMPHPIITLSLTPRDGVMPRERVSVVNSLRNRKGIIVGLILTILLILLLLAALPSWPYSRGWGYGPSGLASVLLIIVLVLILTQTVVWWPVAGPVVVP